MSVKVGTLVVFYTTNRSRMYTNKEVNKFIQIYFQKQPQPLLIKNKAYVAMIGWNEYDYFRPACFQWRNV